MPDYEPDEREQAVLDVVKRERRVNPMRVREVTNIRKQYVNDALKQLTKAQYIRKVNRGLYEYAGGEGADIEAARSAIEQAIRAAERADDRELREQLETASEALER